MTRARWISRLACMTAATGLGFLALASGRLRADPGRAPAPADAERRALVFLAAEVPRWPKENRCFSCHNNGDAARALLAAVKAGRAVPAEALASTLEFLGHPERWNKNGVDAAFSDKDLARLQFAHALAAAVDAGALADRAALGRAADFVAADQADDGSWKIDPTALIGSPATYGPPLATAAARKVLATAGAERFAGAISRADRWLRARPVQNTLDAAAVLLGLDPARDDDSRSCRAGFDLLRRGQVDEGGWGPFVGAPPEVFDTAIAVLALSRWPDRGQARPLIDRGRAYLAATQDDDGGWPPTTRPSNGDSYAQRISTTGWAALALLATDR